MSLSLCQGVVSMLVKLQEQGRGGQGLLSIVQRQQELQPCIAGIKFCSHRQLCSVMEHLAGAPVGPVVHVGCLVCTAEQRRLWSNSPTCSSVHIF